jgi:DNA-directed RNA polymerase specialized sigma24 family protein
LEFGKFRSTCQFSGSLKNEEQCACFLTTRWSMVRCAGFAGDRLGSAAREEFCRLYWKPLFVFCLRQGHQPADAEDFTQSFLSDFLARESLRVADPERGRFRSFLLVSFKRHIGDERDRKDAARRGGGRRHLSLDHGIARELLPIHAGTSPEEAYDRQWALDLVGRATASLREECGAYGRAEWFDQIAGPQACDNYASLAARFLTTEDALKSFAKRLRRRFRQLLEREIADTVRSPEDVVEEMAYLAALLRK